jgi:hypothetical protein
MSVRKTDRPDVHRIYFDFMDSISGTIKERMNLKIIKKLKFKVQILK